MDRRILVEDLDRVLAGTDCVIGTEAKEHRADDACLLDVEVGIEGAAGLADVVLNADGEAAFGPALAKLVEHCLDHGGREFFR